jgi:heat shock protein HslJ
MTRLSVVAAILAGMALAGCGNERSADGFGDEPDLDGRTFVSTRVTPQPLVPGSMITLTFEDGTLGANSGCNGMSVEAWIEGDQLRVTGAIASTAMGCREPLMDQDAWLEGLLTSRPRLSLDGDRLTLSAEDGTVIELVDRRVAEPDHPLIGRKWVLDTITSGTGEDGIASSVPGGVTSTLRITDDGQLELRAGCNTGGARVEATDRVLQLGPVVTTEMMCLGDRMRVERAVMAVARQGKVTYRIEGDHLTLTRGDRSLIYRAS